VSENNLQATLEGKVSENSAEQDQFEEFTVKVNRETNEIILKDPRTGKETPIKAKLETETEEETGRTKPLTVDQFREVWERLDKLGITWTTDVPPLPEFRKGFEQGTDFGERYRELQKQFPTFPRELGTVILHKLLHAAVGGEVDQKAEIIRDLLTQKYRSEFFFKYAIKVPYFEDIDWEVVIKAYERACHGMPKIAYALLMLTFRDPVDTTLSVEDAANEYREPEFITVAVNEDLIDNLIAKLSLIRMALAKAQGVADSLPDMEEANHGTATP
jgi:hypothetical protein